MKLTPITIPSQVCMSCGSHETKDMFSARDKNFRTTDEIFSIIQCGSCGIVFTSPQPSFEVLGNYYPKVYYPVGKTSESYFNKFIGRFQKDKIKKVQRYKNIGKLLDVGCGAGYFVKEAITSGYDAEGSEFSELAAEHGVKNWNLKIQTGSFLSSNFENNSFDILTFWQVLEHLYEPIKVIEKANQLLKKGGLLLIAVPNFDSYQARLFKKEWYHLEVPRHLFHFTPESLPRLVGGNGFDVLETDFWCREHNGAGFLGSIIQMNHPNEPFAQKVFRKTIGKYLTDSLAIVESALGRGGTMTIFAIKK